ncbi:calponin homology domain-containing protein DDB_G0272472-like [Helianthus annuus]|uniref:calponin homology domain-containing protein DDB_G0272472-like n=1 Tax=Helianthus annuus TaxID=4232 RepID=UPI000B8EEA87|nr:calponin homology domain-containing protein DDB_G0272472-like [Helianthus annuus]
MVKGCMLRMGYNGALNAGNYLKSKFQKPYKFLIHCVLISLSHTKGGYDAMRDYQMNMITALVLNKKYNFSHIVFHYMAENSKAKVKTWMYPRFVQMLIDHAYPEIDRNIKDDLLVQVHMTNNTLKKLVKYHPNHPEPTLVVEPFGFIKDVQYVDPDPVNHLNWRNEAEMKEARYADELKILADFKNTKNEWYVKESGRRRRMATPIVREGEGSSSSKPRKKQKKAETMSLVDEPEEDNPVVTAEKEQVTAIADDPFNVDVLFDTDVLETGPEVVANVEQVVDVEAQKEKEKVADDIEGDDVDKSTTSSSSSSDDGIDEIESRKRIEEEIEKEKMLRKRKRQEKDDDDVYVPSPEHVSGSQSSPKARKKAGGRKKVVSPKVRKVTPKIKTPKDNLLDVGDFDFANTSQVRNVEKKVEEVVAENKRLAAENKKVSDREKNLEMRVKKLEMENRELVKNIDSDQSEIDILKVKVVELEEEKTRRDEQNEYFKLKNIELEAAKALRDHEFYMLNKVVESMLGTSVEQKFEELQVEELRAERQAEIERQMIDKGKGVEGSSAVTERSIVPSMVVDNPECITAISGLFEEETHLEELMDDDDDDDARGGTGLKVTEASTVKTVDDLMNDSVNEESGEASGKVESSKTQIVEHSEKLILGLDVYREMMHTVDPEFKFDFEEELESFDINQQPEYTYKYVEEADKYDRVEIEDWTDDEDVVEDASKFPTLMEFFAEENREELRQKVTEAVKEKNFDSAQKEMEKEDRSKWFRKSHERKFKRTLKYYQRDRSVSLGDIISWGYLLQVNAYAIRRECGVQYFERLYDIMSLPWWDVDELPKVRCLD